MSRTNKKSDLMTIASKRSGNRSNPLILTFYLPSFLFSFSIALLAPVLPLYATELASSYGLAGLVLAGESLGSLLSDLPAGLLLSRLGLKRSMTMGAATILLSTVMLFWVDSVASALGCRLLAGFGNALFGVARHAYISSEAGVDRRGRTLALFGGVNRIGRFAGPAIGGMVAASYGLRAPFLVFGLVGALVPAVLTLFLPGTSETRPSPTPSTTGRLWETVRSHRSLLAAAGTGQLLVQAVRAGRQVIIPLYAADVLNLDAGSIGLILSAASAVDMMLFYPTGLIMDRWGRKAAIVPAFVIQALSLALVPFAGSMSALMAVATLGGLGNGLSSGTMMTLGADLAPAGARGEFLGVWRLIGDMGFSGSPIVVGAIADLVTLQAGSWMGCAVGCCAAAVFYFLVPETLSKTPVKSGRTDTG
jgi:MFS family permease